MKAEHLVCPYRECGKVFERPLVLTDFSKMPRETYYACPHCLTKVDVLARDGGLGLVSVKGSDGGPERAPSECSFRFGYLKTLSRDADIPDGCLTCTKLLKCFVKKENIAREV